jgi:hypothetical protein
VGPFLLPADGADARRLLNKALNVDDFLYKDESYRILGACFEVYNEKGCGFLEPVYQECLEIELRIQGVPFVARKPIVLKYKGETLEKKYEPDVVCFEKINRGDQSSLISMPPVCKLDC